MGSTTGAAMKSAGSLGGVTSADGRIGTGCRCPSCRPQPDWNGNRAQRRAAKKAGIPKPKETTP
jgi:hypothetical protein